MIAINGLGRIGRLAFQGLEAAAPGAVAALNDPAELRSILQLMAFDSVHGPGPLVVEGHTREGQDFLRVAGREIPLFHETDPAAIPFGGCGARLVVEASGRFTRRADAARHLKDSVSHVIISAPSPDPDFTVILPLNGAGLDLARHRVISNASCTAHATGPMLAVLERAFGLEAANLGTVHVATNDQRLLDAPHKDLRRARAAFQNIIPTSSSAIGALHQALPWLPADFDGCATRVPCPSVNLVDLSVLLARETSAEGIRQAFLEAAAGELKGILGIAEEDLVSRDFTGRTESVVMDLGLTRIVGGRLARVFGWHDNEVGYAARLVDLALFLERKLVGAGPDSPSGRP